MKVPEPGVHSHHAKSQLYPRQGPNMIHLSEKTSHVGLYYWESMGGFQDLSRKTVSMNCISRDRKKKDRVILYLHININMSEFSNTINSTHCAVVVVVVGGWF